MKSKQILSIEQMKQLQELGLDTSNSNMYWLSYNGISVSIPRNFHLPTSDNDYVICDAYTLQDVLDALPGNISYNEKYYYLTVDLDAKNIYYGTTFGFDLLKGFIYKKKGCLIDAAYSMLCWCIENGYVNTDNSKKLK